MPQLSCSARGPVRQTSESCSGLHLIISDLLSLFFLSMAMNVLAELTRLEWWGVCVSGGGGGHMYSG